MLVVLTVDLMAKRQLISRTSRYWELIALIYFFLRESHFRGTPTPAETRRSRATPTSNADFMRFAIVCGDSFGGLQRLRRGMSILGTPRLLRGSQLFGI